MVKKRLSIIGRGTVGCLNALKFSNLGYEIDWYHDPEKPALSVGEGTDLAVPKFLSKELDLSYDDLFKLDAHYKQGIEKINWGSKPFTHLFGIGYMALHINANKLQNYICEHIKDKVNIIEKKVDNKLNTFTIDCSGTPPLLEDQFELPPIPVNKAYVVQCPWDKPAFNKTICIAKSYGWVFLIPLQNRCSVGYIYNSQYAEFDTLQKELSSILKDYNLMAKEGNIMPFENFYRKNNFSDNLVYNGNASFFLEPLEATSLNTSISIINQTHKMLCDSTPEDENKRYKNLLNETVDIIMLHYLVEPPVKNTFWEYANNKANEWFKLRYKHYPKIHLITQESSLYYATWFEDSFKQNLSGMNLYEKLNSFK